MTRIAAVLLGAVFAAATPASGQDQIPERVSCAKCKIEIKRLGKIGGDEGPGSLSGIPHTSVRDSRGNLYLATEQVRDELNVYSPSGKFIKRLGKSGAGPGEFKMITALAMSRGDTIHVFDNGNKRIAIIPLRGGESRTVPFAFNPVSVKVLDGGNYLISANIATRDLAGYPLHLFDRNGKHVRSFGTDNPLYRADSNTYTMRSLALGRSVMWAAEKTSYSVSRYDLTGKQSEQLARAADWFKPYLRVTPSTPTRGPQPWLSDITVVGDTVWTAITVADRNFAKALDPRPIKMEGETVYRILDDASMFDTVIEAIDTKSGRVVARTRIDDWFLRWTAPGEYLTYKESEEGFPVVQIWRAQLKRPRDKT